MTQKRNALKLSDVSEHQELLKEIAHDLSTGRRTTDFRFDQIFSPEIKALSKTHWTPVEVAIRAAELLVTNENTKVLDVGSGCGKFCIVAALSGTGQFFGVEERADLAAVAKKTAADLNLNQVTIINDNMVNLDWSKFDSFYLFNPFYENIAPQIRIDRKVSHSQNKYGRYIEIVQNKLKEARDGTKVLTYHGFGGEMPEGYSCTQYEPIGTSMIELWEKYY